MAGLQKEYKRFLKHLRIYNIHAKRLERQCGEKKKFLETIEHANEKLENVRGLAGKVKRKNPVTKAFAGKKLSKKEEQAERVEKEYEKRRSEAQERLRDILEGKYKDMESLTNRLPDDRKMAGRLDEEFVQKEMLGKDKYAAQKLVREEGERFSKLRSLCEREVSLLEEQKNLIVSYDNERLRQAFEQEEELLKEFRALAEGLREEYEKNLKESRRVISEEAKKLKAMRLKDDILEYGKDLGKLMRQEVHKTQVVEDYLKRQRSLRDGPKVKNLIAVRVTPHLPKKGVIKTAHSAGAYHRETIHFSLNGAVGDHSMGRFRGKYGILIPIRRVLDRIINISPMDAFVFGDLKMPGGSELFVPDDPKEPDKEKVREKYEKNAGKAEIHLYNPKEDLREEVIPRRLKEKGYTVASVGAWGWSGIKGDVLPQEIKDQLSGFKGTETFMQFAEEIGKEIGAHVGTIFGEIENSLDLIEARIEDIDTYKNDQEKLYKELEYIYTEAIAVEEMTNHLKKKYINKEEVEAAERVIWLSKKVQKYVKKAFPRITHDIRADEHFSSIVKRRKEKMWEKMRSKVKKVS